MTRPLYCTFVLAFCLVVGMTYCKKFTRCELARELKKQRFPVNLLRNWVCLIEAESGRRTYLIGPTNKDNSRGYGLFQINDRYWCSNTNVPGKDCNVKCTDLLADNISKAARCAKEVYILDGFKAWNGWIHKCKGKPLPDLSRCGLQ